MIEVLHRFEPADEPGVNPVYRAYVTGSPVVGSLFTHAPGALDAAVGARSRWVGPVARAGVARAVAEYNRALRAPRAVIEAATALEDPATLCVVTGQQAGFLGGPLYTIYKVVTAIRVARELQSATGRRVVPLLWLATEDHDFQEINHAWSLDIAGQVTRVSFPWSGEGRPIADLVVNPDIRRACDRYFQSVGGSLATREVAEALAPRDGEAYGGWVARTYHGLFAAEGLVVLEPAVLSPWTGHFFRDVFRLEGGIRQGLRRSAAALRDAGHTPPLDPEHAGIPFRFTDDRLRVRCAPGADHAAEAEADPRRFSADAALRPVLQDALLPTAVSVLGPGEIAYQSMLRPVYECMSVPQPLLLPRLSVTLLTEGEADLASRATLGVEALLAPVFHIRGLLASRLDSVDREALDRVRKTVQTSLTALTDRLGALDPNLVVTAQRALDSCLYSIAKLEERVSRAALSHAGISMRAVNALRNAILPRGTPQERIFPLPFLLLRHGADITRDLLRLGDPLRPGHYVAVAPSRRPA